MANFTGKLVFKSGVPDREPLLLDQPEIILGRTAPADLVLDSSTVSRSHAKITCRDGEYFIEDLGSSNGTRVNGHALVAPHRLSDGDVIQVGLDKTLVFEQPSASAPQTSEAEAMMTRQVQRAEFWSWMLRQPSLFRLRAKTSRSTS